jgi:hypothetical protein
VRHFWIFLVRLIWSCGCGLWVRSSDRKVSPAENRIHSQDTIAIAGLPPAPNLKGDRIHKRTQNDRSNGIPQRVSCWFLAVEMRSLGGGRAIVAVDPAYVLPLGLLVGIS